MSRRLFVLHPQCIWFAQNHEIPTKHFPIGERVAKMEISLGQQVAQKSCQEEVNHKPKDVNLGILGGKKIQ